MFDIGPLRIQFPAPTSASALILLFAMGLSVGPACASVNPDEAVHLIIAPAVFAMDFEALSAHRTGAAGIPSCVVTLEDVLASAPAGRDDAETLRNYVVQRYQLGNLRYLLLGGDSGVMPHRMVRSHWYPEVGYTDLESDLYYACLDGDWDADGDGIFGEGYASYLDPGDEVDLVPEIAVGRAPINDAVQARRFVRGAMDYDLHTPAPHLGSIALMAEVIFPEDWTGGTPNLDGASYGENVVQRLAAHASPPLATRLYENSAPYPGSNTLTVGSALAAIQDGAHGLYYFIGFGEFDRISVGDGLVLRSDLDALTNAPAYHFTLSLTGEAASFLDDSILEHMVLAPEGGSSGALGFTEIVFHTSAEVYIDGFFEQIASGSGVLVGDAMRAVLEQNAPGWVGETFERWANYTWCLLGDPAMPFRTELLPVSTEETSLGGMKALFRRR